MKTHTNITYIVNGKEIDAKAYKQYLKDKEYTDFLLNGKEFCETLIHNRTVVYLEYKARYEKKLAIIKDLIDCTPENAQKMLKIPRKFMLEAKKNLLDICPDYIF